MIYAPPTEPFVMQIIDPILPQNDGFFNILPENKVIRLDDQPDGAFVTMKITDVAPLLCGMTSAEELYYGGRICIFGSEAIFQSRYDSPDIVKVLNDMFPKTITFNAEEYLTP
ncbi:MAG: sterol carrier protein domain-containing protein [Defluviitaleaceae bacterium]|nr:sterol carrier protein domain-containing protein [Defluviitaleaceae bacterium]